MKISKNKLEKLSVNPLVMKAKAYLESRVRRLAFFLQKKTQKLSYHSKRNGLVLFCLFGIGCSVGIVTYSFLCMPIPVTGSPIRLPEHVSLSSRFSFAKDSIVTVAQYKRIKTFEQYLARERQDAAGRFFYDSLMDTRPHLLDSLHFIDSLFQSQ